MIKNPVNLKEYVKDNQKKKIKYLVTAISYEDRGSLSLKQIIKHFEIDHIILIYFEKKYLDLILQKKWDKQKRFIIKLIEENNIEYSELDADPIYFHNIIDDIFYIVKNEIPILINITTLPKNYILRLAKEFDNEKNLFFYYRSDIYRKPTEGELNIGVEKIIPIEGFEGFREINTVDLILLILGYEGHRALSFLYNFSPYRTIPIISIPKEGEIEIDNVYYDNVLKCNKNLLRKHSVIKKSPGKYYTISSLNHLNFCRELFIILKKFKNKDIDICISPVGTKPQALGLYLLWRKNQDIQLIYPVPVKRFDITTIKSTIDEDYSLVLNKIPDEKNMWIYSLPKKGDQ